MVKNLPCRARDTGSAPDPGRSHLPGANQAQAPQLLSLLFWSPRPQLLHPRAATTEAHVPYSSSFNKRSRHSEKPAHNQRKTHTATKTQHSKKKQILKKIEIVSHWIGR